MSFCANSKQNGIANIQIYRKSNNKLIKIGSKILRVEQLPAPTAYIGNIRQGPITKTQLFEIGGLIAKGEEFHNESSVEDYTIYILRNNGPCAIAYNKGARFEQSTLDVLKITQAGDKILVSDITVTNFAGRTLQLSAIEYTITE